MAWNQKGVKDPPVAYRDPVRALKDPPVAYRDHARALKDPPGVMGIPPGHLRIRRGLWGFRQDT
jgi:hypothetical protein